MNYKQTPVLLLLFAFLLFDAAAQNGGKVSGNILKTKEPVKGATASLLRAADSVVLKFSVSDKEGNFLFEGLTDGQYCIAVTAVGFQKIFSKPFEVTPQQRTIRLPEIDLTPLDKELAQVTITAKKPLIEQRVDRLIVNVDASITNAGASALEVLEKSPGIAVDKDGNISLKGKAGVLVMIDGRPTQLAEADLASLLRNMPAARLDQIEIMTNPPARYDAAGTAGIINLKTKKIVTAGMNGSAGISYAQGRYPKTTESFNFNYRQGKVNIFTNVSHNFQKRFQTLNIDRNIIAENSNTVDRVFDQEANRITTANAVSAKAGIDFFAGKKTTMGAIINLNARQTSARNPNTTHISSAYKELESITKAWVSNESGWNSLGLNLNFRTLPGKKGREITADIDDVKHRMHNDLFMTNSYTDAANNPSQKADTLTGLLLQQLDVYSARADYIQPLKKGGRLEAGIKSSSVETDNNAGYDSIQYGRTVHDFNRSNHFIYKENINAAYVNLNMPLSGKLTAQLGLRIENTNARGIQRSTGEVFERHYTQLFPTAYLQYKANENNSFGANFGRRIYRPGYQNLNPFIRFIDRYTYSQGNPALKPSISNNFEMSHTWKNQITTTINYTSENDIIREVIQQRGKEAYNRPANVSSLHQLGISVSANTPVSNWWTSNININLYNDSYRGSVSRTSIDRAATSFALNGTQQFKLTPALTAELTGVYRSGWLEGIMKVDPVGFVGAGFSQQVLKSRGNIRLTARDIFHTQKLRGITRYGNVDFVMAQVSETQVVTIGFTYSFSKGKKIAPVKRTAGSANEEQGRIGQ